MPTTDWKYGDSGANVDRDGSDAWSNPANARYDDSAWATLFLPKEEYTDWLYISDYGFDTDVPAGSTIDGIEVEIMRKTPFANKIQDSSLRLVDSASAQQGDDKASGTFWPTSEAAANYGGAADDWSAGLDATDIRHANFGVQLSAYNVDAMGNNEPYVDYIRIRVTYTAPAAGVPAQAMHQMRMRRA